MSENPSVSDFFHQIRKGRDQSNISKAAEILVSAPDIAGLLSEEAEAGELVYVAEILINCRFHAAAAQLLDLHKIPSEERAKAYYLRAFCQKSLGNYEAAANDLVACSRVSREPALMFEATICLIDGNELAKASKLLKQAVGSKNSLKTTYMQALARYCNGRLLYALGRFSEAQTHFLTSIEIDSSFRPAAQWLMLTTAVSGQIDASLELFDQIKRNGWLTSDFFESMLNRLTGRGLGALAIKIFNSVDDASIKTIGACHTVVEAFRSLGDNAKAVELIRQTKADNRWVESLPFLMSEAHALGTLGDVEGKEAIQNRIVELVESDQDVVVNPWLLFSFVDSPKLFLDMAKKYASSLYGTSGKASEEVPASIKWGQSSGKLPKVAFLGADYVRHPVAYCLEPLLDGLSDEMEVSLLSLSPKRDSVTQALASKATNFFDISGLDYFQIKNLVEQKSIDIIFDTSVFTAGGRPELIYKRLAPCQVSYLGFSGTSGMSGYDYIVGDEFLFQDGLDEFMSEFPARLSVPLLSMMLSGGGVSGEERLAYRQGLGLRESDMLFCSLAKPYKINGELLDAWAKILIALPKSFLMLPAESSSFIVDYLSRCGVSSSRVLLSSRVERRREHLVRLSSADLFLDASPYNAHSLAADALSAGVPVLSLVGQSFAARVSGSLVSGVGQNELLCSSIDEYSEKAMAYGEDVERLRHVQKSLWASLHERHWASEYVRSFTNLVVDGLR